MLSSVEQAFVGRDEKRAPLKTPAGEAKNYRDQNLLFCKFHEREKIKGFRKF